MRRHTQKKHIASRTGWKSTGQGRFKDAISQKRGKMCYSNPGDDGRERRRRRAGFTAVVAATFLIFPAVVTGRPSASTSFVGCASPRTSANRRTGPSSEMQRRACTHTFNVRNILNSAASSDDVDSADDKMSTEDDGLTVQERILREAGLSPETPEERAERLQRRTEAENKLKVEKRINVVVAVLAFLAALLNYGWKYTHPVTPIQVLAEMQSHSAPLDVIGRNGRPTVVDFWAPWCENCKFAAPTLQAIEKEYEGKVNFVMVNANEGSAWPLVERFGVDAIPHLAIISAEGDVETALIGPIPRGVLRADLDVLLDNAAATAAESGEKSCDILVPASSNNAVADATDSSTITNADAMASSTMAVAGGSAGAGIEGGMKLPYDVPSSSSSTAASGGSATSTCVDTQKEELPYVMLDVFRSRPSDRRVMF